MTGDVPRLAGRVAIVTGGANGIGRAVVERFVAEGARVLVADVDEAAGAALAESVRAGTVTFCRCDVGVESDVRAAVGRSVDAYGGVDIVVNNAAWQLNRPLLETTADEFNGVMATNALGPFLVTREAAAVMIAQGRGGVIVNVTSTFAFVGSPGYFAYHASKGALASMTRAAAIALMPHGIRVTAVAPGTVLTPGLRSGARDTGDEERGLASFAALQPLGRFGRPEEIAAVVAFLASDEASFAYGANWLADGGYTEV